jgi:hypothetical protein
MELLTPEILSTHVLSRIDEFSILAFAITCKYFHKLTNSSEFINYLISACNIQVASHDKNSLLQVLTIKHDSNIIRVRFVKKIGFNIEVTEFNSQVKFLRQYSIILPGEFVLYKIKIRNKHRAIRGTVRKKIIPSGYDQNGYVDSSKQLLFDKLKSKYGIKSFVCLLSMDICESGCHYSSTTDSYSAVYSG